MISNSTSNRLAPNRAPCDDSKELFQVEEPNGSITNDVGCDWVGQRVKTRCYDSTARENCPVTCGTCPAPQVCVGEDDNDDVYRDYYYYDEDNNHCYQVNLKPIGEMSRIYQEYGSSSASSCNAQGFKTDIYYGDVFFTSFSDAHVYTHKSVGCRYFGFQTIVSDDITGTDYKVIVEEKSKCYSSVTFLVPPCSTATPSVSLAPSVSSIPTMKPSVSMAPSISSIPTMRPSTVPSSAPTTTSRIRGDVITNTATILVLLSIVICCFHSFLKSIRATEISKKDKENRRLKIQTGIIRKKVLLKDSVTDSDDDHHHSVVVLPQKEKRPTSKGTSITEESSSIPVALSFKECCSTENIANKMNMSDERFDYGDGDDDDDDDDDENNGSDLRPVVKDDIYLETNSSSQQSQTKGTTTQEQSVLSSSSSSSSSSSTTISSVNSSNKTCPICLENYKVGDDIAWSKNDQCHHAFHYECIMEWLIKHDECPLCRVNYLNDDVVEEGENSSEANVDADDDDDDDTDIEANVGQ